MNHDLEVLLIISVRDGSAGEQEVKHVRRLDLVLQFAWVPQTLGECVWSYYRFRSKEDKELFVKGLSSKAHNEWMRADWKHAFGSA